MTRTACRAIDTETHSWCTMDKGHTGPHVATYVDADDSVCGNVVAIWPNVPKAEPEVERIVYAASLLAPMDAGWWADMAEAVTSSSPSARSHSRSPPRNRGGRERPSLPPCTIEHRRSGTLGSQHWNRDSRPPCSLGRSELVARRDGPLFAGFGPCWLVLGETAMTPPSRSERLAAAKEEYLRASKACDKLGYANPTAHRISSTHAAFIRAEELLIAIESEPEEGK